MTPLRIAASIVMLALVTSASPAQITEIIDAAGDGTGNPFDEPYSIAVDGSGNIYVAGFHSDNAFKITPGGVITEIIDATGDGTGNPLDFPFGIAVDGSGKVYVTGAGSDNALMVDETFIFADGFESGDTSTWSRTVP